MWEYTLPFTHGQSLSMIVSLFFLYSFLGWMVESFYMSFCNKQLTNRGFIHGPFCPVYGFGALLIYNSLYHFGDDYVALYFIGALLATTIEFLTAKLMIKIFGYVWWDYSNKPFNYKGILCMESTMAWGIYILAEFLFLHNLMTWVVHGIPSNLKKMLILILTVYYMADFCYCVLAVRKGEVTARENNLMAVSRENH